MLESRKAAFAGGAVFALVLGYGTAYAATGGNFILGRTNYAGSQTTLQNSNGTALSLKSNPNRPALKVSNTKKVYRLNADRLDGKSAGYFAKAKYSKTGYIEATGVAVDDDENGFPDLIVAIATCPSGTKMTGGGSQDYTASGYVFVNAPDGQSWEVVTLTDNETAEDPEDLIASVVCYNPSGSVVGAAELGAQSTSRDSIPDDLLAMVRQRAAR